MKNKKLPKPSEIFCFHSKLIRFCVALYLMRGSFVLRRRVCLVFETHCLTTVMVVEDFDFTFWCWLVCYVLFRFNIFEISVVFVCVV